MPNEPLTYQAQRSRLGELDCVVVGPTDPAQTIAAVGVFCHGFGAGGEDLVGLARELLLPEAAAAGVQLVFPAAVLSLDEMGMPGGRAWWLLSIQRLISALEEGRYEQVREEVPEGIDTARGKLVDTIEAILEQTSLDSSRLLLGGFSQGAMLSVDTALRGLHSPPAALCLYSGALICERLWKPHVRKIAGCQVLQSHGRYDQVLPLQTGFWLRDMLTTAPTEVEFIEFAGPHTIPPAAVERTAEMLGALTRIP